MAKFSTQAKFVLGAAATGAYLGDITDDPIGGLLGATVLASTATFMKLTTSDIKGAGSLPTSFDLDQNVINASKNQVYTDRELMSINRVKEFINTQDRNIARLPKIEKKLADNNQQIASGKISKRRAAKLQLKNKSLTRFLEKNSPQALEQVAIDLAAKLKTFNHNITPTYEGLKTYLQGITDPADATRVMSLIRGAKPYSAIDAEDSLRTSRSFVRQINTTKGNALDSLSKHFQDKFNNPADVALEKARLILDRNSSETIAIKGGTVLYTDKFSGKAEAIPITSVTEKGVFYHTPKPGTNFAINAVNPYGTAYANQTPVRILGTSETRVPTFADVTQRMHPELLALQVSQGKSITEELDVVRSQLRHGLDEASIELNIPAQLNDDNISQRFRAAGQATNYQHTLNYDVNGKLNTERPLRKLKMISEAGGTRPEGKTVLAEIMEGYLQNNPEMADNLLNNISLNNTTTLSGIDFQAIAPLSMNQRGATAVGVRDMLASNRSQDFNLLSEIYTGFESQFASSNVFNRLDVRDKTTYNKLLTDILGTSRVLADGAGFFNSALETTEKFSAEVSDRLVLGRQQNGSLLIKDERLASLLETYKNSGRTTGLNEDFIRDFNRAEATRSYVQAFKERNPNTRKFKKADSFEDLLNIYKNSRGTTRMAINNNVSGFEIKAGQVLGVDAVGNEIKLHKQYTRAELTGLLLDENGNLLIHSRATFDPKEERIAKLFSEAAKSNLHGMTQNQYGKAATLAVMLNEGLINPLTQSIPEMSGRIMDAYQGVIKSVANGKELTPIQQKIQTAISSDFILAAEDTNTSAITNVLRAKTKEDISEVFSPKGSMQYTDKTLTRMDLGAKSTLREAKNAALATLMQSNFKSATDLNLTIASDIFTNFDKVAAGVGNKEEQEAVKSMLDRFNFNLGDTETTPEEIRSKLSTILQQSTLASNLTGKNAQEYQTNLYNMMRGLTDTNLENYASGMIKSVGAVNKGQAVLGVGNRARMSWTAYNQLLKSGFTPQDLSSFGKSDFKTLLELEGIFSERFGHSKRIKDLTINSQLGNLGSEVERIITQSAPEARVSKLKTMGIHVDEKAAFISYKLKNPFKELEHLNFNTMTASHSGSHDDGLKVMMKDLEKARLNVFSLDRQLADASEADRGNIRSEYEAAAKKYMKLADNLLKGDNSLVKKAASLVTEQSNISLAMAVGGEASDYIASQKTRPNGVFISEEGLALRTERMGLKASDLVETKIAGYDNLYKIQYKVGDELIDLKSLFTREPAQGPLATTYEDLILDRSLEKTGNGAHAFVTENHEGFSKGKYLDFDQDTLQELFGKLGSKAEQDVLNIKFEKIQSYLDDIVPLAKFMKVKGANKTIFTPADFEDVADITSFKNTAGIQGRERKSLAGVATRLATNLSEALTMEFDAVSPEKAVRGRFLGHVLVENLLKSAHLSTKEFAKQAEADIESLSRNRSAYLEGRLTAKQYRTEIEPVYRRSLNLDNPELMAEGKAKLDTILDDILTAEINQAKLVSDKARTPLDIGNSAIRGTTVDKSMEVVANFTPMTSEIDLQGSRSYGRMAREIKVNIASTIKNNKGILGVGAAALALGSIMTRDGAEVSEERERMIRGNGGKMITGPTNVPMGINTNTTASSYVTPKVQNTGQKSVEVNGDFAEYAEYGDASNYMDQTAALSSAIFGDNLRTARLE